MYKFDPRRYSSIVLPGYIFAWGALWAIVVALSVYLHAFSLKLLILFGVVFGIFVGFFFYNNMRIFSDSKVMFVDDMVCFYLVRDSGWDYLGGENMQRVSQYNARQITDIKVTSIGVMIYAKHISQLKTEVCNFELVKTKEKRIDSFWIPAYFENWEEEMLDELAKLKI